MVHRLSRATSYLQTFAIDLAGNQILRSFATGFFIRAGKSILLITNWHVVSGLDPSDTTKISKPPPVLMKATVISKQRTVTELTLPLYNKELKPVWFEHQLGSEVDLAIYELPQILGNYFDFIDVHSAEDPFQIDEKVASDVFILGYPFSRDEFKQAFGVNSPYYLPVWKRGSIAFEPSLRHPMTDFKLIGSNVEFSGKGPGHLFPNLTSDLFRTEDQMRQLKRYLENGNQIFIEYTKGARAGSIGRLRIKAEEVSDIYILSRDRRSYRLQKVNWELNLEWALS